MNTVHVCTLISIITINFGMVDRYLMRGCCICGTEEGVHARHAYKVVSKCWFCVDFRKLNVEYSLPSLFLFFSSDVKFGHKSRILICPLLSPIVSDIILHALYSAE